MTIQREVGTTNEVLDVFIQNNSVTTGAGLTNLVISTFSTYWIRSDMASTSSVVMNSTGSLSTYSSGRFLQINSTFMSGWYRFGVPAACFAAGSTVAIHMYGAASMAPMVHRYDLIPGALSVSTIIDQMSTANISSVRFSVSSVLAPITVGAIDVTSFYGSAVVTTAAGRLAVGPVGVSSLTPGVRVSTMSVGVNASTVSDKAGYGVSSIAVDAGFLDVNISSVAGLFIDGTGTSSDPWGPV